MFRSKGTCKCDHSSDPVVCKFGTKCKFGSKCKNWHPVAASASADFRNPVVSAPKPIPACKFGSKCRDVLNCKFSHSDNDIELAKFDALVIEWASAFSAWKLETGFDCDLMFVRSCYPDASDDELEMIAGWIRLGNRMEEFECPFSDKDSESDDFEDLEEKFLCECEDEFL
jgi:hypothetical protein